MGYHHTFLSFFYYLALLSSVTIAKIRIAANTTGPMLITLKPLYVADVTFDNDAVAAVAVIIVDADESKLLNTIAPTMSKIAKLTKPNIGAIWACPLHVLISIFKILNRSFFRVFPPKKTFVLIYLLASNDTIAKMTTAAKTIGAIETMLKPL